MPPSSASDFSVSRSNGWLRVTALGLVILALGLPVNDLARYAVLVVTTAAIFSGRISSQGRDWIAAIALVTLCIAGQAWFPAPRIDEGHNIFVVDAPSGALERGLPADAFRQMLAEFNARYPADKRCKPAEFGCWRGQGFPEHPYAFSADAIYQHVPMSRRVTGIDFTDPAWLRLGVINDLNYNWTGDSDLQRNTRNRWNVLHPWHLTMPYFVAYRFPAAFAGSTLCFQGEMLWETADHHFAPWRHGVTACRPIQADDIGRLIVGVSIATPLAITLQPTMAVQWRQWLELAFVAVGVIGVILLLRRRTRFGWPLLCIGLALVVVALNDATFVGGVRPFDGGDDGLFYEGTARRILQEALAGDFRQALIGGEPVFYYGGPGLRYLRAIEHTIFGDTFLGYLSLMLGLPLIVFAAFRRFLGTRVAFELTLIFIAIPVGALFGTTFYLYAKWAARGFADPAAAAVFIVALVVLVGWRRTGPDAGFGAAFGAGLLFALALFLRPNLAPAAGVLLGGAGLAALWQRQIMRLAGLCLGFLPVFGMALHNWMFGGVLVLFSSNATNAETLAMPFSAWAAAFGELLRFDLGGQHLAAGLLQLAHWLAGPSGSFVMIPVHIAAIAILVRMIVAGRRSDPWLRLVAAAALAEHPVAWFYLPYDRYHYLAWFLTFLVCAVWMRDEGLELLHARMPRLYDGIAQHPIRLWGKRALDRAARRLGVTA